VKPEHENGNKVAEALVTISSKSENSITIVYQ
jgi:hypothetical protein